MKFSLRFVHKSFLYQCINFYTDLLVQFTGIQILISNHSPLLQKSLSQTSIAKALFTPRLEVSGLNYPEEIDLKLVCKYSRVPYQKQLQPLSGFPKR